MKDKESVGAVCPVCGRPATPRYRPFCCAHCADVDLGRWLRADYRAPVRPEEEEDDLPG